jgi:hypothetical protein
MNLLVAKGVESLRLLEIPDYQRRADSWAADIQDALVTSERQFHAHPEHWKNDIHFFRLGVLCWYVDEILGIRYREDQKGLREVRYIEPSDLFLNGVMDTRQGTCANMPTLHVALAWRLGWPVSLACAGSHFFARFDNGQVTYNVEATNNGQGGFHSHPDQYYRERYQVSAQAIHSGSDLRAANPRELLAFFFRFRARYFNDTGRFSEARQDYVMAGYLFPTSTSHQFSGGPCSATVQASSMPVDAGQSFSPARHDL